MKKLFAVGVLMIFAATVFAQQASTTSGPVLTFEKNSHDFGDMVQGDKVEKVFRFKNSGNEPLIITNIQVTCGCTAPKWPREPIMPGAWGEITIAFNSAGKLGRQDKTVTVISNASNDGNKIMFTANVLEKTPQ